MENYPNLKAYQHYSNGQQLTCLAKPTGIQRKFHFAESNSTRLSLSVFVYSLTALEL